MARFAEEFRRAYLARCSQIRREMQLQRRVDELRAQRSVLEALAERPRAPKPLCPVLLGSAFNRVYVTSIGTFPPYKCVDGCFYPVGFESKRRHRRHRDCTKTKKDRLQYVCTVTPAGPAITAEDGRTWSGSGFWEQFAACADEAGEFGSFAEFAGLSDPKIVQLIEAANDTSAFPEYVPYSARHAG